MADEVRTALAERLRKGGGGPERRRAVGGRGGDRPRRRWSRGGERHAGAGRHERTPARTGRRTGERERARDTRVGTVELRVPRARGGGSSPSLPKPRTRGERALLAVAQEASVAGVSTRRGDGRPGRGPRDGRHRREPGRPAVPGAGRGGRAVPGAAPDRGVPVPVARRPLRRGAGGGAGGQPGGGRRGGGDGGRRPGGARGGRGAERGRGVLAALPAVAGGPRPARRAESFFKTLKREEVYLRQYQTFQDAEANLGRFIEDGYNAKRLHSSLGYRPPIEFEAVHAATARG